MLPHWASEEYRPSREKICITVFIVGPNAFLFHSLSTFAALPPLYPSHLCLPKLNSLTRTLPSVTSCSAALPCAHMCILNPPASKPALNPAVCGIAAEIDKLMFRALCLTSLLQWEENTTCLPQHTLHTLVCQQFISFLFCQMEKNYICTVNIFCYLAPGECLEVVTVTACALVTSAVVLALLAFSLLHCSLTMWHLLILKYLMCLIQNWHYRAFAIGLSK